MLACRTPRATILTAPLPEGSCHEVTEGRECTRDYPLYVGAHRCVRPTIAAFFNICKPIQENVNQTGFYLSINFKKMHSFCGYLQYLTKINKTGG